jgi:hypothetical protein
MTKIIFADASPEKRLFINLLTRDITLVAAFLDLLDNSINAAVEPYSSKLKKAADYEALLKDPDIQPSVDISISLSPDKVVIKDNASGISVKTAEDHVFKFGRAVDEPHENDRLSVYGIGLKRALFKLGNNIAITSDHEAGGFNLKMDVAEWASKGKAEEWKIPISPRPPVKPGKCGTTITVTELYDDIKRRLADGVFEGQLRDAVARTYAYYMTKFVTIHISCKVVEPVEIAIGSNHYSDSFELDGVSCAITAGIGIPRGGQFRDSSSGWFVFCNGRAVISADKSPLTGWGGSGQIFQPKHRPFVGTVFFASENAEQLPWTTTKAAINEDSAIWQLAKRNMHAVSQPVIAYLNNRYTDEGTEVSNKELQEAAGEQTTMLAAAVSQKRSFTPPAKRVSPKKTRIQYDATENEIKSIAVYLKRPSMSGSAVGRYTFDYFLRNEVEGQ